MDIQNKTNEELQNKLRELQQEINSLKVQKANSEAALIIANKELLFQNIEKNKRAEELRTANLELGFQNEEKEKRAAELIVANVELAFQKGEKGKRVGELVIANIELDFQNEEKRKRAAELIIANVELAFQKAEKGKRALELIIANKELAFQNGEKGKRAIELTIANKELAFQNGEKVKRADELIIAKIKIVLQGEENEKLAAELIIANLALVLEEELIAAKEKAEESEIKFHNLFENSPIAKSITGIDGSLMVNKSFCDILGYSKEELKTKKWQDLTFPEDIENSNKMIQSLFQGANKQVRFEKRYVHKNGTIIYADVATFLQYDNDNNPQYFITAFNDITELKRAEKEIIEAKEKAEESEANLRTLVNTIPDLIWQKSVDGKFLFVNSRFEDFFGAKEKDIIGKTDYDFVDKQLADFFVESDKKAIQNGIPTKNEEFIVFASDKHSELLETTKVPVLSENKKIIGILGIGRNITEQRKVEQALKDSDNRWKYLFKDIPNVAVQGYDKNGITKYWNKASETLYGYSAEEAIGTNLTDLIIPEEQKIPVDNAIKAMFTSKIAIPSGELKLKRKDGSAVIVLSSHSFVQVPGLEPEMYCIDIDISGRKQAEFELVKAKEKIEESEEKFSKAFFSAPFPIIIHAEDGEVVLINQTFTNLTGYSHKDIPTIPDWTEKAYGKRGLLIKEYIHKLFTLDKKVDEGEYEIFTADGREIVWDFSSASLGKMKDGRILVISMANDITERKKS